MTRTQYFSKRGWQQTTTLPKKNTKLVKPLQSDAARKLVNQVSFQSECPEIGKDFFIAIQDASKSMTSNSIDDF